MAFQAAKCPECGADIQVPTDRDTVKCMYCGKDIIVRQAVQAVGGPNAQNWMKLAAAADDAGNHEEAYRYFTRVLEVEPGNAEAWLGKAISAGWGSNLRSDRLGEMISGIEQAIACAADPERVSLKASAAISVTHVVLAFYKLSLDHTLEFITVDSSWPEHIARCLAMVAAMKKAIEWSPGTRELLDADLAIVEALLKGIEYARGEFKDGFAYLHLPADVRQRMETERADLIAKIKAIDPSYVEKKVKTVGGPGCGCIALVVVAFVVLLFAIIAGLGWLSHSAQRSPAWSPPTEQPSAVTTATTVQTASAAPPSASPETERLWASVVAAGDDLVVKNFFIERLAGLPSSGRIAIAMAQAKAASAAAAKKYCAAKKAFVESAGTSDFDRRSAAHCEDHAPISHDLPSGPVVLTKQCTTAYSTTCP